MSGVLRTVAKVAGIIAMIPSPIQPIAAAVAATATIGAALLAKKPPARGSTNGILVQSDAPAPYLIGRTYFGGVMRHDVGYGGTVSSVPNPYRGMVMVYSTGGPLQSLVGLYADFTAIPMSGASGTGYWNNFLYASHQLGATPEAAALAPAWPGMPNWSSAHKLSGKAAILWTLKFDKKGKVFAGGVPQLGAIWEGVKVYDPRKDSTYPGGSGAHRVTNEATWEYSQNPALHALTYIYGRKQNGKKIFGIGQTLDGVEVGQFVELANVCDANDWKVGGTIFEPMDRWQNLKDILAAGGAEPIFTGGKIGLRINAPRIALDTITAEDLADDDISITAMQTWRNRINGIVPKYRSEAHKWEYVPSELVTVASYVTVDGEEKNEERQWNLVQDKDQVAQLAAYDLVNARELGPIELVCKPRMRLYGPGNKLIVDLPEAGLDEQPCIVLRKSIDPGTLKVTLTLISETDDKHDFALGKTGTAPPTPTLTAPDAIDEAAALSRNVNVFRGAWAADTAYVEGDLVTYNGSTWVVTTAHTSSAGAPPPNANVATFASAGLNTATVVLYQRSDSSSPPALPASSLTYTFLTGALTGSLGGWTLTDPGIGSGANRWETRAYPAAVTPTATIAPGGWSAAALTLAETLSNSTLTITSTGVPAAADGTVSPSDLAALGTQFVVKRDQADITNDASVVFSVVSEPDGDISINTAANVPVAGKPKGYVTVHSLTADIATFVVRAQVGGVTGKQINATYRVTKDRAIPGSPGASSSLVRLYRRTTTNVAPAVPDNNITFTFADNSLSGSLDGWSQTEPAVTVGSYLWETFAWASGTGATKVIAPGDWLATPNLLRNDDYRAATDATAFTVPAEADGTVDPGYLTSLEGQLYFRTSGQILVGPNNDTAGVTLSLVSAGGGTATINTATNTPTAGKPKGYFKITGLAAGMGPTSVAFKATYGGVDYPALPVVVTKALAGQEAIGLRLNPSRDRLTRDAWGRLNPATQTFVFTPERENFAAGTVTFEVRNANNVIVGGAPTYGTVTGGNFEMTEAQVLAAAGSTRGVIVYIYDTAAGGKYGAAHAWVDGYAAVSWNEWPDPQLNTGDSFFTGGALAAPFSIQTNGAALGYKYNNFVRIVSTTTPGSEFYGEVFERLPVSYAGEPFYWGYSGGKGVGSGALGGGIYLIFRDVDGNQVGTTQKLFNTTAMTPTGDWPIVNGAPVLAPADAAYVEGGYYRNAHGAITSSQYQIANAYLSRSQPNANNTEANQARMVWPEENQIVSVSYSAGIKTYPTTLRAYRYRGDVDVTTSTAWSIANPRNMTVSIGAATGIITVSAVTGQGSFDIVALHNNYTTTKRIFYNFHFDDVPIGIGNVSNDSPNSSANVSVSNTSFGSSPIIGPYEVETDASGTLTFYGFGTVRAASGQGKLEMKPQYRVKGSGGAWTDSSPVLLQGAYAVYNADTPEYQSIGGAGATIFVSANTAYEVRWIARMDPLSTSSAMILVNGSFWVRGQ